MMTKWICMACVKPCLLETDWESVDPKVCVMGLYNSECPNWKRDCTEETEAAKFKMTYTYKELDKKVQDLITAGQGQMARIQALEKKIPDTWVMWSDRVEALEKTVEEKHTLGDWATLYNFGQRLTHLERIYRKHNHMMEDDEPGFTSKPRYRG